MAAQAAVLAAAVAVCVFIGRSFDLTITLGNVALDLRGRLPDGPRLRPHHDGGRRRHRRKGNSTRRRNGPRGRLLPDQLTRAGRLLDARPARYLSLFYWSVGDNQISNGVSLADYAVLIAVGLCALYAAVIAFRRLDLQ